MSQMYRAFAWATGAVICLVLLGALFASSAKTGPRASFAVKVELAGGHGSGAHIGNGYVLTAAHVADAGKLKVVTDTGQTRDVEVLWSNKEYDVALLRITDFDGIDSIPLSCAKLTVGAHYVAYGSPGEIDFVSAAGEVVGKPEKRGDWHEVATVNGAVVMGMSGGPAVSRGWLVGISVGVQAVTLGGEFPAITGFGFIVPSSAICGLMGRA